LLALLALHEHVVRPVRAQLLELFVHLLHFKSA